MNHNKPPSSVANWAMVPLLSLLVCVSCAFVLFMAQFCESPTSITVIENDDQIKSYGIYVSIYTYAGNRARVQILNDTWLPSLFTTFSNVKFELLTNSIIPGFEKYCHLVQDADYVMPFTRLIGRFFVGLETFIESGLDWYLCTTDDIHIFVRSFKMYMDKISSTYDTANDKVFKGQVLINQDSSGYFIHGGSGYLFSRRSVEILLAHKEEYLSYVEDFTPDDVTINHAIRILNLTLEEINDPQFLGTDLHPSMVTRVVQQNFTGLPDCDFIKQTNISFFADAPRPFKDVVIWHGSKSDSFPLVRGWKYPIPEDVNVYIINSMWGLLCKR